MRPLRPVAALDVAGCRAGARSHVSGSLEAVVGQVGGQDLVGVLADKLAPGALAAAGSQAEDELWS
jgi:hypothetical protein